MANFRTESGAIEVVTNKLDELGLRRADEELVVVGGAAMAIYGIKEISKTDLDIAVTPDLLEHLTHDDRWKKFEPRNLVAEGHGVTHKVQDPHQYAGYKTAQGDVTAIPVPLQDSYPVDIETLLEEIPEIAGMPYPVARLERILDWKLGLATTYEHAAKEKHMADALKISKYLLEFQ